MISSSAADGSSSTERPVGRRRAEVPAHRSIDEVLEASRRGADRVEPADLPDLIARGAHVIDLRSERTREPEGHIPGATVMERLVLEWRLDPGSAHRMADGPGHDDLVILVCNEGYYSSLAARDLRDLGFSRATDLVGGFRAYRRAGLPVKGKPTRVVL
ncbi:rhodanese-like domain-containing protein [Brachybacterium sp. J144]|uniref:rhodanese-like domain-containing protein n=1 Tax=Brachybacterium sp. J144 TaxID=3116487 RepID=UPI002E780B11|nr:rhodanese-like domain-containing protein [Brachybacterium sp. J144]MEE1651585.1 rhodanese-like domain-containing protein [Brachybacterium sp. J144]